MIFDPPCLQYREVFVHDGQWLIPLCLSWSERLTGTESALLRRLGRASFPTAMWQKCTMGKYRFIIHSRFWGGNSRCVAKVLKQSCLLFFLVSWLFEGLNRQKAEELLSLPMNRVGSFMVRESSRERGEHTHLQRNQVLVGLVGLCFSYWARVPESIRKFLKK